MGGLNYRETVDQYDDQIASIKQQIDGIETWYEMSTKVVTDSFPSPKKSKAQRRQQKFYENLRSMSPPSLDISRVREVYESMLQKYLTIAKEEQPKAYTAIKDYIGAKLNVNESNLSDETRYAYDYLLRLWEQTDVGGSNTIDRDKTEKRFQKAFDENGKLKKSAGQSGRTPTVYQRSSSGGGVSGGAPVNRKRKQGVRGAEADPGSFADMLETLKNDILAGKLVPHESLTATLSTTIEALPVESPKHWLLSHILPEEQEEEGSSAVEIEIDPFQLGLALSLGDLVCASTPAQQDRALAALWQYISTYPDKTVAEGFGSLQNQIGTLSSERKKAVLARLKSSAIQPSIRLARRRMLEEKGTRKEDDVGKAQIGLLFMTMEDNETYGTKESLPKLDDLFVAIDPNNDQEKFLRLETTRYIYALELHRTIPTVFDILDAVVAQKKKQQNAEEDLQILPVWYKKQLILEYIRIAHPLHSEGIDVDKALLQRYFIACANKMIDPTMDITLQQSDEETTMTSTGYVSLIEGALFAQLVASYERQYQHLASLVGEKQENATSAIQMRAGCEAYLHELEKKLGKSQTGYAGLLEKYNSFRNGPVWQSLGGALVEDAQLDASARHVMNLAKELSEENADAGTRISAMHQARFALLQAEYALYSFQLSKTHIIAPGSPQYHHIAQMRDACIVRIAQLGHDYFQQACHQIAGFEHLASQIQGRDALFVQTARKNDYSDFFPDKPKQRDIQAWIAHKGFQIPTDGGFTTAFGWDQTTVRAIFKSDTMPGLATNSDNRKFVTVSGPDGKHLYLEVSNLARRYGVTSFEYLQTKLFGSNNTDNFLVFVPSSPGSVTTVYDRRTQQRPYMQINDLTAFHAVKPVTYNRGTGKVYFHKQLPDESAMIDDSDPLFRQGFMKFGEESKIEEHIQSQRSIPLDRRNALQNANGGYPYNGRVPIATHESIRQDQGFDRERISTLMEHPVLIQAQSIARRMQAEFALLLVSPPGKEYTPEILAQILDPTFAESLTQSVASIRDALQQPRFVEGVKQLRSLSDSMKQELGITDQIEAELNGLLDQIESVQRFFKRGGQADALIDALPNRANRNTNTMGEWLRTEGAILITVLIISIGTMGLSAGLLPGLAGMLLSSTYGAVAGVVGGELATHVVNRVHQETDRGRQKAGIQAGQYFQISTPYLQWQQAEGIHQKRFFFDEMLRQYGMQVVNQVGMNMGIQAFALTIARPARQSIRHIPDAWKQAWGDGWGTARKTITGRCAQSPGLTSLFQRIAGSPYMKTSLQAWTKSSSAIEKFGKVAQLDELGEEFLEETVREQIAGELAGPYGQFLVGVFGSAGGGGPSTRTDSSPAPGVGGGLAELYGLVVEECTATDDGGSSLVISYDTQHDTALRNSIQEPYAVTDNDESSPGFSVSLGGDKNVKFVPSAMPVSLRRGGVSASGSIGEIFPNSYGTRSAEIRGASGLSLSSLASTFCIGTGTLIDGETVYTVQGLEHIQALSARLLQADVDTKTLAPLVADPVTYAEIAVHSMTPLVSSQEYSSIVAAIRNIGDNHTAARVALALHLCPELATIAIQGYSTLTELIQTAHSRPDNFMTGWILRHAGLSAEQTKILMRWGICGKPDQGGSETVDYQSAETSLTTESFCVIDSGTAEINHLLPCIGIIITHPTTKKTIVGHRTYTPAMLDQLLATARKEFGDDMSAVRVFLGGANTSTLGIFGDNDRWMYQYIGNVYEKRKALIKALQGIGIEAEQMYVQRDERMHERPLDGQAFGSEMKIDVDKNIVTYTHLPTSDTNNQTTTVGLDKEIPTTLHQREQQIHATYQSCIDLLSTHRTQAYADPPQLMTTVDLNPLHTKITHFFTQIEQGYGTVVDTAGFRLAMRGFYTDLKDTLADDGLSAKHRAHDVQYLLAEMMHTLQCAHPLLTSYANTNPVNPVDHDRHTIPSGRLQIHTDDQTIPLMIGMTSIKLSREETNNGGISRTYRDASGVYPFKMPAVLVPRLQSFLAESEVEKSLFNCHSFVRYLLRPDAGAVLEKELVPSDPHALREGDAVALMYGVGDILHSAVYLGVGPDGRQLFLSKFGSLGDLLVTDLDGMLAVYGKECTLLKYAESEPSSDETSYPETLLKNTFTEQEIAYLASVSAESRFAIMKRLIYAKGEETQHLQGDDEALQEMCDLLEKGYTSIETASQVVQLTLHDLLDPDFSMQVFDGIIESKGEVWIQSFNPALVDAVKNCFDAERRMIAEKILGGQLTDEVRKGLLEIHNRSKPDEQTEADFNTAKQQDLITLLAVQSGDTATMLKIRLLMELGVVGLDAKREQWRQDNREILDNHGIDASSAFVSGVLSQNPDHLRSLLRSYPEITLGDFYNLDMLVAGIADFSVFVDQGVTLEELKEIASDRKHVMKKTPYQDRPLEMKQFASHTYVLADDITRCGEAPFAMMDSIHSGGGTIMLAGSKVVYTKTDQAIPSSLMFEQGEWKSFGVLADKYQKVMSDLKYVTHQAKKARGYAEGHVLNYKQLMEVKEHALEMMSGTAYPFVESITIGEFGHWIVRLKADEDLVYETYADAELTDLEQGPEESRTVKSKHAMYALADEHLYPGSVLVHDIASPELETLSKSSTAAVQEMTMHYPNHHPAIQEVVRFMQTHASGMSVSQYEGMLSTLADKLTLDDGVVGPPAEAVHTLSKQPSVTLNDKLSKFQQLSKIVQNITPKIADPTGVTHLIARLGFVGPVIEWDCFDKTQNLDDIKEVLAWMNIPLLQQEWIEKVWIDTSGGELAVWLRGYGDAIRLTSNLESEEDMDIDGMELIKGQQDASIIARIEEVHIGKASHQFGISGQWLTSHLLAMAKNHPQIKEIQLYALTNNLMNGGYTWASQGYAEDNLKKYSPNGELWMREILAAKIATTLSSPGVPPVFRTATERVLSLYKGTRNQTPEDRDRSMIRDIFAISVVDDQTGTRYTGRDFWYRHMDVGYDAYMSTDPKHFTYQAFQAYTRRKVGEAMSALHRAGAQEILSLIHTGSILGNTEAPGALIDAVRIFLAVDTETETREIVREVLPFLFGDTLGDAKQIDAIASLAWIVHKRELTETEIEQARTKRVALSFHLNSLKYKDLHAGLRTLGLERDQSADIAKALLRLGICGRPPESPIVSKHMEETFASGLKEKDAQFSRDVLMETPTFALLLDALKIDDILRYTSTAAAEGGGELSEKSTWLVQYKASTDNHFPSNPFSENPYMYDGISFAHEYSLNNRKIHHHCSITGVTTEKIQLGGYYTDYFYGEVDAVSVTYTVAGNEKQILFCVDNGTSSFEQGDDRNRIANAKYYVQQDDKTTVVVLNKDANLEEVAKQYTQWQDGNVAMTVLSKQNSKFAQPLPLPTELFPLGKTYSAVALIFGITGQATEVNSPIYVAGKTILTQLVADVQAQADVLLTSFDINSPEQYSNAIAAIGEKREYVGYELHHSVLPGHDGVPYHRIEVRDQETKKPVVALTIREEKEKVDPPSSVE